MLRELRNKLYKTLIDVSVDELRLTTSISLLLTSLQSAHIFIVSRLYSFIADCKLNQN